MIHRTGPSRHVLANGMTVLAEERGLGPVVFSGVVYRVGSRDERPGITGISHVLEHMMFKGTRKYAKGEVAALVERNGGDLNAFTSEDVTMYYEVFARDRWELALAIESERMVNLRIEPDELESEREVILEERTMYLDVPAVELSEELSACALRESPYRWPIIGWENDIRSITHADLMEHYSRYYTPGNATLVVVGDVQPDTVFAAAERHFGRIPAGGAIDRRIPVEPEFRACTRVDLKRQASMPQFQLLFRAPEIRTRDSEALYLIANLLSGTRTSRLDLALLETNRAGDVHVQFHAKADPSTFTIGVEGQPGVPLDEIELIVWEELAKLSDAPIEADELERARNQVEAQHVFSMQSPSNRGFTLGWHDAQGDVTYADRIADALRSLTPDELRDVARRTFTPDRCAVGRLLPEGNGGAARPFVSAAAAAPGLAGNGPHGVFSSTRRFRTGLSASSTVRRTRLANGMRVMLQPDATDPVVSVSLLFHGGSALDEPGVDGLAHLTAETLERGTKSLEFVEFNRRFERIGSTFALGVGAELAHCSATALTRHSSALLGLLADLFEAPGFRGPDLEVVRALALNDLAAREDDLDDVAEDRFLRGVAREHPYGRLPQGSEEGLRAATVDAIARFHADAYRPDRAHLAIVGDFAEAEVLGLVEARFGRLAAPATARPPTPALPDPDDDCVLVDPRRDKGQARIFLGGPGFSASDPDRLAGIVMNQILGGSSIRSRLGDELRDRLGLAYSVYSRNYERSAGGFFFVHMGTRPENVIRAVDGMRAELSKMAEGVTPAELDDARAYLTGSFPLRFTTYGRLARFWTRHSFYEWPEDYLDTYVERVQAITAEDVRRAAERVRARARVLAVAGPVGADLRPLVP